MTGTVIPSRPLLKPWYRLAENGDGLLLECGGSVVALSGHAARRLLPLLLPLLDGTRTVEQLVEAIGPAVAPAVENALVVLHRHGLLEEGPALEPGDALAPTVAFLKATGAHGTYAEVAETLRSAQVRLVGRPDLVDSLARLLLRCGVRPRWAEAAGGELIVAAAPSPDELDALNRTSHERGTTWMPVGVFDGRIAEIGPLVVPGETACSECVRIRRRSTSGCPAEQAELRAIPASAQLPPTLSALAVAIAAHDLLRWLAARDPAVPGVLTTVEVAPDPVVTRRPVLRVPRCPVCSAAATQAAPTPWYEALPAVEA